MSTIVYLPGAAAATGDAQAGDTSVASAASASGTSTKGTTTNAAAAPSSLASSMDAEQKTLLSTLENIDLGQDPAKAEVLKHWVRRVSEDRDISRMLKDNAGKPPFATASIYIDGMLRITPDERTALFALSADAHAAAPKTCVPVAQMIFANSTAVGAMSAADLGQFFDVVYDMLKQSAIDVPIATITPEQRAQGQQAVNQHAQDLLKNDPQSADAIALAAVDPYSATPESRCLIQAMGNRALLATPEPYRDWAIIAQFEQIKTSLAAMSHLGVHAAKPAQSAPQR
ncbi:hypothetical protein D7S86_07595 [Pararobbsia silviterrae]|uniref:Uncharacterized protein n=2 Tax=Pararobbsia silviterrae TaxID=1792498 RepID=A0A494Y886_9BURK|nr:hypothetical protein D7S86_07595 [Pararobbsia silviterrae]